MAIVDAPLKIQDKQSDALSFPFRKSMELFHSSCHNVRVRLCQMSRIPPCNFPSRRSGDHLFAGFTPTYSEMPLCCGAACLPVCHAPSRRLLLLPFCPSSNSQCQTMTVRPPPPSLPLLLHSMDGSLQQGGICPKASMFSPPSARRRRRSRARTAEKC